MGFTAFITAVLLTATMASAQTSAPPAQAPAQGAAPQTQSGAAPSQSSDKPPAPPAAGAAPAAGSARVLQAKSQDELKAYQDVMAKTDPALVEAGADDFAAKYPNSELRGSLYVRAMNLFGQQNNTEKVIITGRQAIAADPTNPIPLVQLASTLAETTRDTDLDREQRLTEAAKDAHAAIDNIDTGLLIPANADPERVAGAKRSILTMAYDTLGMIDMVRSDYTSAEKNLQMAIDQNKTNPEAVLYLRLSVAQDKLKQYPQALDSATKAVQYAKEGTTAQNLAKQQQARVQKLMTAGAPAGGTAPPAGAASPVPPAGAASPVPSPTPGSQQTPSPVPTSPGPPR